MSFLSSLGRVIFDPANLTGAFDEGGNDGPVMAPGNSGERPGFSQLQNLLQNPFAPIGGETAEQQYKHQQHEKMQGYMQSMGANSDPRVAQLRQAWDPNAKAKPSDWSAQWSYTPGKGPQWIEPKRVSPNGDVPWAPVVNTGPAKGNRF